MGTTIAVRLKLSPRLGVSPLDFAEPPTQSRFLSSDQLQVRCTAVVQTPRTRCRCRFVALSRSYQISELTCQLRHKPFMPSHIDM